MTPTEEMPDSYRDRDEGLCCIDSGEGVQMEIIII